MSCDNRVSKPNVLFDIGDTKTISHVFEVKPGEVYVVSAQGLMDGDVIAIETVTGCGAGDLFECYRNPSCDCGVELTCDNTRVVIPFTGRYRLSITTGVPGDYRVTALPTSDVGFTEGNMACGCSSGGSAAKAVDSILASPSALAGLCQGLAPCINAAVATAVAPIVTAAVAAVPTAASDNPAAFTLLEDAFGVDIGYVFQL